MNIKNIEFRGTPDENAFLENAAKQLPEGTTLPKTVGRLVMKLNGGAEIFPKQGIMGVQVPKGATGVFAYDSNVEFRFADINYHIYYNPLE